MWLILLLQLAPQLSLSLMCHSGCECIPSGDVKCTGAFNNIPPLNASWTFRLNLRSTNITFLNARFLERLTLLQRLRISHSPLSTIHPEAFQNASQLRSLVLSSNSISVLPPNVFSSLRNLEQLNLSENQLVFLGANIFEHLGSLKELEISKNQIAQLDANIFQNLTSLNHLNLCGNLLRDLPQTVFLNLPHLKSLILYSNQLETIEKGSFDHLHTLLVLMLHKNQIKEIPPKLFWHMPSLLTLTLSSNQLQYIPAESFYYLPNLTKLTLYNNPLITLPDQLVGHMPRLHELYLYYTNLSTVPWNLFVNMTGLVSLKLHMNAKLHSLPKDLFCCLPNLQNLSLKDNNLQDLHPDQFSGLTKLKILLLNNNMLQSLSPAIFQNLRDLSNLDLRHNHLRNLPGDIFENARALHLESVTLGGNRWDCTCSILRIAKWISQNQMVVVDLHDVLCYTPYYLQNYQLHLLTYHQLHCGPITAAPTVYSPLNTAEISLPKTVMPSFSTSRTTTGKGISTSNMATTNIPPTSSLLHHTSSMIIPSPYITEKTSSKKSNSDATISQPFYNIVVLDNSPNIVHNNYHKGWVYLWTVPTTGPYSGFMIALHIVLLVVGVMLILASAYALFCLNKAVWELATVTRNNALVDKRLPLL